MLSLLCRKVSFFEVSLAAETEEKLWDFLDEKNLVMTLMIKTKPLILFNEEEKQSYSIQGSHVKTYVQCSSSAIGKH